MRAQREGGLVIRSLLLAALLLGSVAATAAATVDIILDPSSPGKMFEGIGAASGGGATSRLLIEYPEPQRTQILDYLFKPQYGASLQLLKVEIGSDGNSTEGSEPTHARSPGERDFSRGYEWWLVREARRRNPAIKVIALAWNFPAWVGAANSQATADYLVSFLEGARDQHLDVDFIGLWNETKMDTAFIPTLRATIAAHGLSTRLVADDSVNSWDIVGAMDADPALRAAVDAIATHYPRFLSTPLARQRSTQWTKSLWSSEDGPWDDVWGASGQQSPPLAQLLNRNYIQGRISSTNIWCLVTSFYDTFELPNAGLMRAKAPWSGHYEATSPLWVVAHTTQFAQPGWRYMDSASLLLPGTGSVVALRDGARYSVVLETLEAQTPTVLRFNLRGALDAGPVHVWRSDAGHSLEKIATLSPHDGLFEFSVQPNSLYTFTNTTGQHKGDAVPPADASFPFPYHDDFERPAETLAPRFLFDANGAFERIACEAGRAGYCLRQQTERAPISWSYYMKWPEDGTLAALGDPRWRDYRVAADLLVGATGYAALYGRIARVTAGGDIDAYQLRLYADGRWELRASASDAPLRRGQLGAQAVSGWHHVELTFHGDRIGALLDGKRLTQIDDRRHGAGLAGIGDAWNRATFDNLSVTAVASGVAAVSPVPVRKAVAAPVAPEPLVPQPGDHTVRLAWKPVPNASSYRVHIGKLPDTYERVEDVGNVTSYTFRTLTNGVKYYFGVSAINAAGVSKVSGGQYAVPGVDSGQADTAPPIAVILDGRGGPLPERGSGVAKRR